MASNEDRRADEDRPADGAIAHVCTGGLLGNPHSAMPDVEVAITRKKAQSMPNNGAPLPSCPVVCLGGGEGAIEALATLLEKLPPDLEAAFVAFVHREPNGDDRLLEQVGRAGSVRV